MEANWITELSKVNCCNTCNWNVELGMKFCKKNNLNKIKRKKVKLNLINYYSTKLIYDILN